MKKQRLGRLCNGAQIPLEVWAADRENYVKVLEREAEEVKMANYLRKYEKP